VAPARTRSGLTYPFVGNARAARLISSHTVNTYYMRLVLTQVSAGPDPVATLNFLCLVVSPSPTPHPASYTNSMTA
jgi:hypothetical protein